MRRSASGLMVAPAVVDADSARQAEVLVCVDTIDFRQPIQDVVVKSLPVKIASDGLINAVRISARARLARGVVLGATNALNGDKVLPINEVHLREGETVHARVQYQKGAGLGSLIVKVL